MDILSLLTHDTAVTELAAAVRNAGRAAVRGSVGASTSILTAALSRLLGAPALLMVAHGDDADAAFDDLTSVGAQAARFPALEIAPGERGLSLDLVGERLAAMRTAAQWAAPLPTNSSGMATPRVLIAPVAALMQAVPSATALERCLLTLRTGDEPAGGPACVVRWLDAAGYRRVQAVEEPGDFAPRGGILDIFPPGEADLIEDEGDKLLSTGTPVRLDFLGDQIERISEIDVASMAADRTVHGVQLVAAKPELADSDAAPVSLLELLPRKALCILHEHLEIIEQARGYWERCTDSKGIFAPPAVLKLARDRLAAFIEVSHYAPYAQGQEGPLIELPVRPVPQLPDDVGKAVAEVAAMARDDSGSPPTRVVVVCGTGGEESRFRELLREFGGTGSTPEASAQPPPHLSHQIGSLHAGFIWEGSTGGSGGTLLLPYHELLQRPGVTSRARSRRVGSAVRGSRAMDAFLDLEVGDYVVHTEHGIARFAGLILMKPWDAAGPSIDERLRQIANARPAKEKRPAAAAGHDDDLEEFLTLEFEGNARLHVPAMKIALVQKYVGGHKGKPPLSTLGVNRWRNQKQRVADGVKDLAAELLRVRAAREHLPGIRYPGDTAWQQEFEAEFPFEETEDQLAAIAEIKKDMASARPMDRLLCGDVGYGKTEVAVRAAFKAAEFGKQVAVLVPTTVLAEQHERTFSQRFKDYPFKVRSVSRFKTDGEIREALEALKAGQIDVIIGTHRLLSKDVRFADLGVVVIDEEQRFGVEHKERLLALRMTADVLTLSATPIPRTLHMSMLGLRDISNLTTAPADRRAVVTEVIPFNATRIKAAIARELSREGQVYWVHNRVFDIVSRADDVRKLAFDAGFPDARVLVGHGQMADGELEEVMLRFMRREADILVSTTIIESGIDIATANTMIIDDADRFGLADLHQLRGRVGRSRHRAYCYLLQPDNRPLKEQALQRLKAVEQFSMLGAGFKIAMRDLEIRGAGNILGPEQSGHIASVGYEMYCQLLDRAVRELKNESVATPNETNVEIGLSGVIPRAYIPSDSRRLDAYRRLSTAATPDELTKTRTDLEQAYGKPPKACQRLLDLAEVRVLARALDIRSVTVRGPDVVFTTDRPADLVARFKGSASSPAARGSITALPPKDKSGIAEVYFRPESKAALEPPTLSVILRKRLAAVT